MENETQQITEQQNNIFWRDGNFGECVGGFHFRTSLKQIIDQCTEAGLNPVGIKVNDEWDIEIIVERNDAYKQQYEDKTK
jgi:hypothetical protein